MPGLVVDTSVVRANTEVIADLLRERGLELVAVTKGCLGEPEVATAMLAGGAVAAADARDMNLRRLREALPGTELHRIHLPSLEQDFEPGDVNYVSSWETAEVVVQSNGAGPSRVMLQVDTGDQREGVPLDQATDLAQRLAAHPELELVGVATNYACLEEGDEGLRESVKALAETARCLRGEGLSVDRVSGGNSSVLWLVTRGEELPSELTELRCGEALLLGHDALRYQPIPGCREDACLIEAEVVEEYTRRAATGPVRRLLLGVGWQDLSSGAVEFREPGLREIGRSSDYVVVEVEGGSPRVRVGQMVKMIPDYEALVAAWMSPYVETRILGPEEAESEN
jgi:predicted amino acid racemase